MLYASALSDMMHDARPVDVEEITLYHELRPQSIVTSPAYSSNTTHDVSLPKACRRARVRSFLSMSQVPR